jgi:hypothetical protein
MLMRICGRVQADEQQRSSVVEAHRGSPAGDRALNAMRPEHLPGRLRWKANAGNAPVEVYLRSTAHEVDRVTTQLVEGRTFPHRMKASVSKHLLCRNEVVQPNENVNVSV